MSNSKMVNKSGFDKHSGFLSYRLQNSNNEELKESIINNISVNELSFETPESVSRGNILECEIYQRRSYQKDIIVPIVTIAKVIRINKIGNNRGESGSNRYRVELKF